METADAVPVNDGGEAMSVDDVTPSQVTIDGGPPSGGGEDGPSPHGDDDLEPPSDDEDDDLPPSDDEDDDDEEEECQVCGCGEDGCRFCCLETPPQKKQRKKRERRLPKCVTQLRDESFELIALETKKGTVSGIVERRPLVRPSRPLALPPPSRPRHRAMATARR